MIWQSLQMLATNRGGNRYSEQSLADDDPDLDRDLEEGEEALRLRGG